jgi:hypothetical protein
MTRVREKTMSWTLLLLADPPPAAPGPQRQPQGMGSHAAVRDKISAGLGYALAWYKDGWAQYGDDDCLLEFHVPLSEDPVVCVMIRARGTGAVETLLRLAQLNGWCLVDGR